MKVLKFILIFIASIITFVVLLVASLLIAVTGGKDFSVEKTPVDIETTLGESIYDAFKNRTDEYLSVDFSNEELNGMLNYIIVDSINSSYEDENFIVSFKGFASIRKAKISVDDGKIKLKARIKYGPLSTNFTAVGKAEYSTTDTNFVFTFKKAKLGHISINPTSILKEVNSDYIKDGKVVYPLDLASKVGGEGIGKLLLDNCPAVLDTNKSSLSLKFDLSKMMNEGPMNDVTYTVGDIAYHSLAELSSTSTSIKVTQNDFNGYIKYEYDVPTYSISEDIMSKTYLVKTDKDVFFDTLEKKIYVGMDIEGLHTYIVMDFDISCDSTDLIFDVSKAYLNKIELTNEIEDVLDQVLTNGKYKISLANIEAALNNMVNINSASIDSEGNLVFGVSVI